MAKEQPVTDSEFVQKHFHQNQLLLPPIVYRKYRHYNLYFLTA